MNDSSTLLLAACGLVVLMVLWRLLSKPGARSHLPYVKRPALLSPAELRLYAALLHAVPSGLAVFAKVRLMDVVAVPAKAWHQYGAPASGMHVDFLLVDASTTEPRLVIELDDRSHLRSEVRRRDAVKDGALMSAGLPVLRIVAARRYDVAELRTMIGAAVGSDHP